MHHRALSLAHLSVDDLPPTGDTLISMNEGTWFPSRGRDPAVDPDLTAVGVDGGGVDRVTAVLQNA